VINIHELGDLIYCCSLQSGWLLADVNILYKSCGHDYDMTTTRGGYEFATSVAPVSCDTRAIKWP